LLCSEHTVKTQRSSRNSDNRNIITEEVSASTQRGHCICCKVKTNSQAVLAGHAAEWFKTFSFD